MRMNLRFLFKNGKEVSKYYKEGGRRFVSNVVPELFEKGHVFVSYGKKQCSQGCICEFTNSAEATTKEEVLKVIKDFTNQ